VVRVDPAVFAPPRTPGAPHLARFSRDVGFHGPCPQTTHCVEKLRDSNVSTAAQRTNAMAAKVIPGINPALVPVVPMETYCIPANRRNRLRPGRSLIHLQQRRRLWLRLSRLTPASSAFFVTSSTRASITQPPERPATLVAILPVDLHACTGSLLHPDPSRLSRLARKIVGLLRQLLGILFADKPYAFVTHL
jgi:hypothetical protein